MSLSEAVRTAAATGGAGAFAGRPACNEAAIWQAVRQQSLLCLSPGVFGEPRSASCAVQMIASSTEAKAIVPLPKPPISACRAISTPIRAARGPPQDASPMNCLNKRMAGCMTAKRHAVNATIRHGFAHDTARKSPQAGGPRAFVTSVFCLTDRSGRRRTGSIREWRRRMPSGRRAPSAASAGPADHCGRQAGCRSSCACAGDRDLSNAHPESR
jgi:hypothetical protein